LIVSLDDMEGRKKNSSSNQGVGGWLADLPEGGEIMG
jgi:hypothetical protein